MKTSLLSLFLIFLVSATQGQTVLFSDDFESGTNNWFLTGTWGTTPLQSNSPSTSLTESPVGNYADQMTMLATMSSGINLDTIISAELSFWAIYDLENGFDYMYVDISADGGNNWINIAALNGQGNLTPWIEYTYSLGGFVGNSDVRVRFRFVSDQGLNFDGMYIDDVTITSFDVDNSPPLILHTPPELLEGSLNDFYVIADIIDISGINQALVTYNVDGGSNLTSSGTNTIDDEYVFLIPAQSAGSFVEYWIAVTDGSPASNVANSDTFAYVAGNHIFYDNAMVDFVNSVGPASASGLTGTAVRISITASTTLSAALIRNYTDINRPNSDMQVHIWSATSGFPDADLITPITLSPTASLNEPHAMTYIDLRPYSAQLANLTGDIFIGYTVPTGETWLTQSTPGIANRTVGFDGSLWGAITDDYHFRAVTQAYAGAPTADFSWDASSDPQVAFTDLSSNSPNSWFWEFQNQGATNINQSPSYTFSANGNYNVCLTAGNTVGVDKKCQLVLIQAFPVAIFNYSTASSPTIQFFDQSTNVPQVWAWDFDDLGATSSLKDPTHTFSASGNYDVCLIATNNAGPSVPSCETVVIFPTGIHEVFINKLSLKPNPANQQALLSSKESIDWLNADIQVFNLTGQLMDVAYDANENGIYLKVGNLASGQYLIIASEHGEIKGGGQLIVY